MTIEVNKDIEEYKETVALGLNGKQIVCSVVALIVGAVIILGLYRKIGLTMSCYIATPIIAPIGLLGFYSYNGMNFFELMSKYMKSFHNKELIYNSTESCNEYIKAKSKKRKVGKQII